MSDERPSGDPTRDHHGHGDDPAGQPPDRDFLDDLSDDFPDEASDDLPVNDGGDGRDAGGSDAPAAGRPERRPGADRYPVASRGEVLRAFLSSGTGGALVALAAVLLIVATLIAVRGNSTDDQRTGADRASQIPSHTGGTPGRTAPADTSSRPGEPNPPSAPAGPGGGPGPSSAHSAPPEAGSGETTLPVTVLNNTTVTGLAKRAADEFARAGWPIAHVGNYTGRIPATTVYFTPGHVDEERAARALADGFPRITRVLPRYEGLPPSVTGVIVVLAPDWLS